MTTNSNTKPLLLTASSRLSAEEVLPGTLPGGVVVKRANAAGRRDQTVKKKHTRRVEASGSPSSSNGRPAPRETEAVGPGSVSVTVPIKNPAGAVVPSPGSACPVPERPLVRASRKVDPFYHADTLFEKWNESTHVQRVFDAYRVAFEGCDQNVFLWLFDYLGSAKMHAWKLAVIAGEFGARCYHVGFIKGSEAAK